jgi:2-keto-3-deoxy-L-fuconate dehydrogenase
MFSLQGKLALITGAGSGIGAAIAEAFAGAGAAVVVADLDPSGGQATVDRIAQAGGSARYLSLDITQEPQVTAAVQGVGAPLDILVNNAGVGCVGSILQTPPAELDRLVAVNIRGTYLVTRAFLPAMLERGRGSVIHLASIAGVVALRDRFAYVTTKFAVVGMTKALALDHSHRGVRFNAICPGRVETPWIQKRLAEYPDPARREAALRDMNATQLAGRMVRPDEVAAAALYLASDEAAMVTGSTLMVDSGWSAGK